MAYSKSDYGNNVNAGKDRNNAKARGWGNGWPNCQWNKFVVIERAGVRVSTRREIAQLVATLFSATEKMGYDIKSGQTWGTACRAIRGTNYPSNHSWGLAFDLNSLSNPMAAYFKTNIPPKVVRMWERCGFFWGGRYSGRVDTMHFEYIGRPSDVAGHLKLAKSYLAGGQTSKPKPKKPAPKPSGLPTLNRGDRGATVRKLQGFMNRVFPSYSRLKADGVYGRLTEGVIKEFQKRSRLKVDGIVGSNTWAALRKVGYR